MKILKQLWSLVAVLGPAPAGKPAEGPPALEPAERGMFDAPEGEEEAPAPRAEEQEEEQEEQEEEQEERTEPRAEDEDEDEDSDEDSDEDDGDETDETSDEDDDTALTLQRSWETRLEAEARSGGDGPPRLRLSEAKVREGARKKFAELQDKGGESDADAIFEVAMDAALQVLGAYHDDVATPSGERIEKSLRNVQVGRTLSEFRKEAGKNLTTAVETKMAAKYHELATKFGWKRADAVPLKDLFRMAGGRMKKGGKAAPAAPPEDAARAQKKQALGAASGPRALGRTRPEGGSGPNRKEDRVLREFSEDVRGSKPFFQFS